jgi:ribA/ribD-fused uncharacterized protein
MFNTMHQDIKTSETATHVFFLNGPFSQWHPSRHLAKLSPDGPLIEFNCAEQHMMAGKADLMGDDETLRAILAVEQDPRDWRRAPRRQKELGRRVRGRDGGDWTPEDVALWDAECDGVVLRANLAKFGQNPELHLFMTHGPTLADDAFGSKHLVEGAHYDRVWGVGLSWDDPAIVDPDNWNGQNRLGETLVEVRRRLDGWGGRRR